ncbi:hypothetical protein MES5069_520024 [Mesorhizobium escarrei]|uniref:Uncharacterized protein n=1 Tax=Mesorhizobium escarrei TaxID=666018 RepID=A0ABM9EAN3_9HYPH|nr:hypothetical protein MES5069_520024 [Mesorhizobium escarrei]
MKSRRVPTASDPGGNGVPRYIIGGMRQRLDPPADSFVAVARFAESAKIGPANEAQAGISSRQC